MVVFYFNLLLGGHHLAHTAIDVRGIGLRLPAQVKLEGQRHTAPAPMEQPGNLHHGKGAERRPFFWLIFAK
jgi:hypothetical protein